jgi:hypothetical protein
VFFAILSMAYVARAEGEQLPTVGAMSVFPERLTLASLREGRQLIVTSIEPDGTVRDLTRSARYSVDPPGIVAVTPEGYVRPSHPGEATVTVESSGRRGSVVVAVRDQPLPLHFDNEIVPLLSRNGCNAGGCHGKASGQNGFRLSLFGFDPVFDYDTIVREAGGRRVLPVVPERSLLLLKPTGQVPHGGGRLFDPESETYQRLRQWIAQGMPRGDPTVPTLAALEIVPPSRILAHHAEQQLAVLARYSDGSTRDVTHQAQFQSNEPGVAAVDPDGLVRVVDSAGEAAIMARYQGLVAVFRATVPLGGAGGDHFEFPAVSFVDTLASAKWRTLGLVPSEPCGDAAFIRRVFLDLRGKLPAPDVVRSFLADNRPDKRARLVDRCLEDPDYAAFFAMRWGAILRNSAAKSGSEPAAYAFHAWLRDMIARNRPYDEFVRGILTASGQWQDAPPINWYWQMSDDPLHQPVGDTAEVFLGIRLQCARCHHHPYERWSQDDYYGLAGFFSRLGRKDFDVEPAYFTARTRVVEEVNPRTGQPIEPKLPGAAPLQVAPGEDPRHKLVDWMVRPDNPFFAKAFCNRIWGHLMGRGLVEPVDDLRATNPPSNPELLDALAREFVTHRFDVKHLIRTICNSRTYQLGSAPNDSNRRDRQNHARYYAKRLIAEVLLDAVDQVCGTHTEFDKIARRARAVDLPHEGFSSYFLDVFNRPARTSACECARGRGANLSQVLHLANSSEIEDKLASEDGRIAKLVREKVAPERALEEIYLAALAREPTPAEKQTILAYRGRHDDPRRTWEDLVWTLLNSQEFLFNH